MAKRLFFFFVAVCSSSALVPLTARAGTLTTLYSFSGKSDGGLVESGVILKDRVLYGTTYQDGQFGFGTVYSVDTSTGAMAVLHQFGTVFVFDTKTGKERILYRFRGRRDGFNPDTNLAYANGVLYGTTGVGGTKRSGTLFQIDIKTRIHTVLHNFTDGADGAVPMGGLIADRGVLYGTTMVGGTNRYGTVFTFKP